MDRLALEADPLVRVAVDRLAPEVAVDRLAPEVADRWAPEVADQLVPECPLVEAEAACPSGRGPAYLLAPVVACW